MSSRVITVVASKTSTSARATRTVLGPSGVSTPSRDRGELVVVEGGEHVPCLPRQQLTRLQAYR